MTTTRYSILVDPFEIVCDSPESVIALLRLLLRTGARETPFTLSIAVTAAVARPKRAGRGRAIG
ncbi:MAG: hypothetical protein HY286_17350 [Planctomycetes bacterium]|nr:hypothetical protein [Planctomycetota bacterium]